MRFLFFLGPFCEGAPPAGGGGENLFPGDYDYIRQGRGHNVCLAVSRDGAEQAVDVCFDLTAAPAGDFSLAFDGGLTLAYADADRTCHLTFTDDAMSGGPHQPVRQAGCALPPPARGGRRARMGL